MQQAHNPRSEKAVKAERNCADGTWPLRMVPGGRRWVLQGLLGVDERCEILVKGKGANLKRGASHLGGGARQLYVSEGEAKIMRGDARSGRPRRPTRQREKVREEAGNTKELLQRVHGRTKSQDEAFPRTLKIRLTSW